MTDHDSSYAAPQTKAARHALITRILAKERIRSQAELREALAARGMSTTQATLSQVHVGSPPGGSLAEHTTTRLARWCADLLVTAEWAGQQLVLRTPAGAAQLLASAVDDAMLPGVLGCIAGDDTVLVITRTQDVTADVAAHLLALADPAARH